MFSAIKLVVKPPHSYGRIGARLVSGVPDSGVGKSGGGAFGRKEAIHEEQYFNQKQKEQFAQFKEKMDAEIENLKKDADNSKKQIEVIEKKLAEMKIESPAQFASGVAGSGVGRGGGGGGAIRDAGGAFGKMEAAHEEQYFYNQQKEQLAAFKAKEIHKVTKDIEKLKKNSENNKGKIDILQVKLEQTK